MSVLSRSNMSPNADSIDKSLILSWKNTSSPTSSSGFEGLNQFSWSDDGQPFQTSSNVATGAAIQGDGITIVLTDCSGTKLRITVGERLTTRTYPIGDTAPLFNVTYEADDLSWFGSSFFGGTIAQFGSGSLTISTVDSVGISGNFNFELVSNRPEPDLTKSVQGRFEILFFPELRPGC